MIKFNCLGCGQPLSVPDEYSNKRIRCANCKRAISVPVLKPENAGKDLDLILFHCNNCNQKMGVNKKYSGRKVRCAACGQGTGVPKVQTQESLGDVFESESNLDGIDSAGESSDADDIFSDVETDDAFNADIWDYEEPSAAVAAPEAVKVQPVAESGPLTGLQSVQDGIPVAAGDFGRSRGDGSEATAGQGSMLLALVAGFFAAMIGAVIWAVIACVTGYEMGVVAWGIGALAGFGLTIFTQRRGVSIGLIAAGFALLGILAGKAFIAQWYVVPQMQEEFLKFELSEEQIQEAMETPHMIFAVACLHLAQEGQFEEFAWEVMAYHGGVASSQETEEIKQAEQKAIELIDNWSEDEKEQAIRTQGPQLLNRLMAKTGVGLIIAFIATFSWFDLIWLFFALGSAYKIGAGKE